MYCSKALLICILRYKIETIFNGLPKLRSTPSNSKFDYLDKAWHAAMLKTNENLKQ